MELLKRCIAEFSNRDWQRGTEYFRAGAVSIVSHGPTTLHAEVEGSSYSSYRVQLDWSKAGKRVLAVDCSCPRFDDVGMCKHVAAVIQAADAEGIGARVPGTGPLALDADDLDDDYDAFQTGWADDHPSRAAIGDITILLDEKRQGRRKAQPKIPDWKRQLTAVGQFQVGERHPDPEESGRAWTSRRQYWYLLDLARTMDRGWPCISLRQCPIKKDGTPGKLKNARLSQDDVSHLSSAEDRTLIEMLIGNDRDDGYGHGYGYSRYNKYGDFAVAPAMFDAVLPRLCASERFGWLPTDGSPGDDRVRPLAWDDGAPWKLHLDVAQTADRKHWQLQGKLRRGSEIDELSSPLALLGRGLVIFSDRIARFDCGDAFSWVAMLRQAGPLRVPRKQEGEFIESLIQLPNPPPIEWPKELRYAEERPVPSTQVTISKPKQHWQTDLECRLTFQYGERSAPFGDGPPVWYDRESRRAVRRDLAAEDLRREQLLAAGAKRSKRHDLDAPDQFFVAPSKMPKLVLQLTAAGWQVEAEGRLIRNAGSITLSVTSGVDWFDLEGTCDFGGVTARLPELLAALRKGQQFITLDDGSQGMLPDEWLARYAHLAELGQAKGDRLRYLPTQAALLDALLAAQDSQHVRVDERFARLRDKLAAFQGIEPHNEPESFLGELRTYQREGLGWLHFLDEFGFGGCLADDMGLGKTVQVLALLEERRQLRTTSGRVRARGRRATDNAPAPSLVVVPRSLVFNWNEEAKRFTSLRVLNYTGLDRRAALAQLNDYDLVVTTYGTLRRDIAKLCEISFDYTILDEAQAIKNASSQAAKACRLLRSRRRLAMTGTPVENHLGELWSLFEFLNPGMLGSNQKLSAVLSAGRNGLAHGKPTADRGTETDLTILSRALRPFMLRRTKQQVLAELPAKSEQTLYCDLDGAERKLYDELREHYRRSLFQRIEKVGVNKAKIHVLEALLRLRQAACHPGLLDKKKIDAGSSKLETLLEQLAEVIDEGHKALVFSQFTSLLAIVRRQLDQRKIVYEYLDGKTTKRQAKVERFQADPACQLFLISLRAGGLGLNLTAADYVFILDPWWNPAVEAQAVDRAHRIGQNRHVFAYRLIARGTVEEKILELQEQKRDLAEAIVSADNGPLRNLTSEDLQLLLS